jgi:hypothetical protein
MDISRELETRLTDQARKLGISVDDLLRRLIGERSPGFDSGASPAPELPVWHLGAVGSLHRRDIYSDVR